MRFELQTGVTDIDGIENDRSFSSRRDNGLLPRDWSYFSEPVRGFVFKKSCITNLLEALDIMTMTIYEGYLIDGL